MDEEYSEKLSELCLQKTEERRIKIVGIAHEFGGVTLRLLRDENENGYGDCRLVKQNGSSQTATGRTQSLLCLFCLLQVSLT